MPLITGSKKADTLDGVAGDDTIHGMAGNDSLNGLGGADVIDGGEGADTVRGGEGNDIVTAGSGDIVSGENGDDVLRFVGGEPTGLSGSMNGDAGIDTLTLDFSTAIDALTASNFGSSGSMAGVSYSGIEHLAILGGSASDSLAGGEGDDTLNGGGGNDRLDGKAGANVLIGGTGRDIGFIDLTATAVGIAVDFAGTDIIIAGTSFSGVEGLGIKGGSDADVISVDDARAASEIYGGGGADALSGVNGWTDTLDGGAGNDTVSFYRGDVVRGGDGDDVFTITTDELSGGFTSVAGDVGADRVVFDLSTAFDAVSSSNNSGFGNCAGVSYSGVERVEIYGGTASDTLVGGAGADTLTGGRGNDRLDGQTGANLITGGEGRDIAVLDLSADTAGITFTFRSGNKPLKLGTSKLVSVESVGLKTGSGADHIDVTAARSKSELFGNAGNDTLAGSAGWNDTLDGGTGDDLIVFGGGDVVRGGDGEDVLRIDAPPAPLSSTQLNGDAGVDTLRADLSASLTNISSSNNNAGSGLVAGISYSGVELVDLKTGAGNDTLAGGEGSDTLAGGAGNDSLSGASDLDYLTGGAGADQLTGGLSGDHFVYLALTDSTVDAAGRDTIGDWSSQDRIDVSALDADAGLDGDQAFTFIGAGAFNSVAGELRAESSGGVTVVSGDVDGDGDADFAVAITGTPTLSGTHFVL